MYNEEKVVFLYAEEMLKVIKQLEAKCDCEVIFVHDGAKDNTLQKMYEVQSKYPDYFGVVDLSRNFGLEGAVHAGLKTAKGDAVVVMDADLQDPPSLILEMVKKWEAGADIVVASREARTNDGFFKRTSANLYYKVLDALSGKLKLEKNAANYRLLSRKAVDQLLELPEVNTYFRVDVPFIGMKTDKVLYNRAERAAGTTNYDLVKLIRCALDGLTSISIEPLRKLALFIPVSGLLFLIFIVLIFVCDEELSIIMAVLSVISFFFFLLFVALFIISEYIAQIMMETRHRPTSIIYNYKPSNKSKENGIC